ncbi:Uu.00g105890.m01.CDS01 [Anthostomella pinea]|uniref:Uu.00g105890.m01.CDS01 n=1 Tax=Anthostomella pinea TaxID=933095 RepID=A0AAI8YFZ2_9PEZI|nr:Uu.00g105890.m01.CDS01 [Anthostomella pinea]
MSSPLSPSNSAALNVATPPTTRRLENTEVQSYFPTPQLNDNPHDEIMEDTPNSSPFVPQTTVEGDTNTQNQENASPSKSRHQRILSGNAPSPLKILSARSETDDSDTRSPEKSTSPPKSPRKLFPDKRFPVKIHTAPSPEKTAAPGMPVAQDHEITLEDAMRQNEGLAKAIEIFEDEDTMTDNADEVGNVSSMPVDEGHMEDEAAGPDDTMVSTFSDFSAIPNMTMFAQIGHTPTRFANGGMAPNSVRGRPERSPQRTPRPPVMHESGNTTNLLMDFTEQIQNFSSSHTSQMSPSRRGRFSPDKRYGNTIASTPQRGQSNLLDFDIPPLPTPSSIPTVTPRELESLKSAFLSEISSLKASLSGKEAEVTSLKAAVGDAEKRVGESLEMLREVRGHKDALAEEKENWERRGVEMENVLRKLRQEIVLSHREREELESKLDESEKRREAAEIMAQEAESKMAGMRAGKATADADNSNKSPQKAKNPGSREVEIAVERVARELHALYKSKHETKVTALKKSYEARWEKRVRELEDKLEHLLDENEKLRLGRDATMTRVDPNQSVIDEERKEQAVKDSTQIRELNAEMKKLEAVVKSVKIDNNELRHLLERERVEKGELVQLAEEMMSMQQSFIQTEKRPLPPTPVRKAPAAPETVRSSVGRASGLRAPGSVKKPKDSISRIGGIGHERAKHGGSQGGLPRPGSGTGSRSGILSSIERMGSYRGRAE